MVVILGESTTEELEYIFEDGDNDELSYECFVNSLTRNV